MKIGVFIIPTGIGATIGGFAGDASKWARKLAKKCKLIVNPNVVNAACFSGITDNMLYVEGYTLDEFFKGNCIYLALALMQTLLFTACNLLISASSGKISTSADDTRTLIIIITNIKLVPQRG